MLFAGAGGLAAQLFDDLITMNVDNIVFWSETESDNAFIKEKYTIFSTDEEVSDYFRTVSRSFIACVGDRVQRRRIAEKFIGLGGEPGKFISPFGNHSAFIGAIGSGTIVLRDTDIEPGAMIGDLCLINKQCNVGHGCTISSYCDMGPMVTASAESFIGENCMIGMGAIIIPGVRIGNNVTIQAGAVVTKNIAHNAVVSGVPAAVRFYKKK